MAMLAAVAVILGYFSIEYGQFIRIGFSGIPNGIVDYLFGPVAGAVFDGALDIIKYLMKPTGPFCPQLTLVVMLAGVLYGCFFYKKKLTIWRVLAAKFVVMLICNVILNTLCLQVLYGQALMAILPMRALKNLIMWPIDSIVFFGIAKALEQIGLFPLIRRPYLNAKVISSVCFFLFPPCFRKAVGTSLYCFLMMSLKNNISLCLQPYENKEEIKRNKQMK